VAGGEFLQRYPAFGFEPDVNQGGIVLDGDDAALDDGAFQTGGGDAERLLEQRGETLSRAEFGGFGCYGHSFSSIPDCGKRLRRDQTERAAGEKRARPHGPGPARKATGAPRLGSGRLVAMGGERALNNLGGQLEHLIGVESGRVYRNGIGGCRERSDPTPAVA